MKLVAAIICFTVCILQANAQNPLSHIAEKEKRIAARTIDAQNETVASNNYTVHYYQCWWQVNPSVYFITGKVTAHFTITQPTANLVFDLSSQLTVDSVLIHGQPISFLQTQADGLSLTLPSNYSTGDTGSVTFFYKGRPPTADGSFVQSTHNGAPIIWTLSEPYGAKDWWPCRNGLDDKADSIDVYIIHPSQYKSTSNGLLQSEITSNNTTTTFYKHRYPIASYLVAIAVSNYTVLKQQIQLGSTSLPIIQYIYPESVSDFQSRTYLLLNGMKVFYACYGDYPFSKEKYGQTQFGWGGGMEHQTNSFVVSTGENLMVHELAHQWFGDKVTCGSWQDIWLNEGFAEYNADFLYSEKSDSLFYKSFVRYNLAGIISQPNGSVWVPDTTSVDRIFDERLTYLKGSFLVRMLRWELGDSAFFYGLRNYLNDPKLRYSFARVSDLRQHLEETGHKSLDYFFKQWYYGQGFPSFKVAWQQNLNNFVTATISQTTSDTSVKFFKVPLQLTFQNATQSKTFVITDSINNQQQVFDIGFAADTVLIDPDMQLISANNVSIKLPLVITTADYITVYPNPFKNSLQISIKNPAQQQWQAQLYNAEGKKLLLQTFNTGGEDAILQLPVQLNLAAGIYFLKIDGGDVHVVKKVLKVQ